MVQRLAVYNLSSLTADTVGLRVGYVILVRGRQWAPVPFVGQSSSLLGAVRAVVVS